MLHIPSPKLCHKQHQGQGLGVLGSLGPWGSASPQTQRTMDLEIQGSRESGNQRPNDPRTQRPKTHGPWALGSRDPVVVFW